MPNNLWTHNIWYCEFCQGPGRSPSIKFIFHSVLISSQKVLQMWRCTLCDFCDFWSGGDSLQNTLHDFSPDESLSLICPVRWSLVFILRHLCWQKRGRLMIADQFGPLAGQNPKNSWGCPACMDPLLQQQQQQVQEAHTCRVIRRTVSRRVVCLFNLRGN